MKRILLTLFIAFFAPAFAFSGEVFTITPINHATFVLQAGPATVYVDPVGAAERFAPFPPPDLILITHIHKDHLDPQLVATLKREQTQVIGPPTVTEQLGYGTTLRNGEANEMPELTIEAIAAYNTTVERLNFHPKARDNGYVLSKSGVRLYISGDTEDIAEMRALRNIDIAFVCMNLPYTMTVEQAADAVNAFKPAQVIPYHYRGKEGMSDLEAFERLVTASTVRKLTWY